MEFFASRLWNRQVRRLSESCWWMDWNSPTSSMESYMSVQRKMLPVLVSSKAVTSIGVGLYPGCTGLPGCLLSYALHNTCCYLWVNRLSDVAYSILWSGNICLRIGFGPPFWASLIALIARILFGPSPSIKKPRNNISRTKGIGTVHLLPRSTFLFNIFGSKLPCGRSFLSLTSDCPAVLE